MLAVRRSPYELHGAGTKQGHGVGGFVQQTILMRGEATSAILWRWPDEVGRAIDPANDPPDVELAPFLFRDAQPAAPPPAAPEAATEEPAP